MPELDEKQFRCFIYATGNLGFGGSNDEKGFQQYWVAKGFFLERLPELERFFKPKCYTWRGNRPLKLDKEFQPLDEIFVWHKAATTNRYSEGDSGFSHMYLAMICRRRSSRITGSICFIRNRCMGLHTSR